MNPAHAHLILNHVPVIGVGLALLLLLYGMARRHDDLIRAALAGFVLLAVIAVPAYLTGEPAEDLVKNHPGTAPAAVEAHEDAAGVALAGMGVLGLAAVGLLVLYRRRPIGGTAAIAALILAVVLAGLLAWTTNLGGKIHHTEVASGTPAATHSFEHDD